MPVSWFWLKPLSLNRPTSLTRPALNVAWGAAVPLATKPTAASTTAMTPARPNGSIRCFFKRLSSSSRPTYSSRAMLLPAALAFICKTADGTLWLGRGCKENGGIRPLRPRIPVGSLPGAEPPPRTHPALLRRRAGARVRHQARGRPQLAARQAPRSQLPSRDDAGGDRRVPTRPALAVVLGLGALEPSLAGATGPHSPEKARRGGVHAAQRGGVARARA